MHKKYDRLKKWELSLLIALCITLCVGVRAEARQSRLQSELVRLHVIAVSDDEYEQELKLRVRDAVLGYLTPMLENAGDARGAKRIISEDLEGIKCAAEGCSEGRRVTVTLGEEYYPTRDYGSFALPAGHYDSLRVVLGDGEGHNWWCVVFPPLCISAAESEKAMSVLNEYDYGLITESDGCEYRFRIAELWGMLTAKFRGS